MAASKPVLVMFMIASFASGVGAFLLAVAAGSQFVFYSIPGFVIGAFFAIRYAMFDRNKAREEEHRKRRSKH